jgi:hypothetical protein
MTQLRRAGNNAEGAGELQAALGAAAVANGAIQQADAKVGTLAVIQAGMAAVVSAEGAALITVSARAGILAHIAALIATAVFVCGFYMSSRHLVHAIRPRLDRAQPSSRFGIATLIDMDPAAMTGTPLLAQCAEAWSLASVLADVAMRKHADVSRAIPWFGLMLVAVAGRAGVFVLMGS